MRASIGLLLALMVAMLTMPSISHAQGVTRLCFEPNIFTGSPSCIDVSPLTPLPIRSGSYGTGQSSVPPQYCQITSLATAVNLVTASCSTGTIDASATIAEICVSTQGIRYTSSGVITPTATIGIPVAAATCFQYSGPITTLKLIQQAGGAVVDIETFR